MDLTEPAVKLWRSACEVLMAPTTDQGWKTIEDNSPPESMWHSLKNCVAHQSDVWASMLAAGIDDVIQPAAFKLAIVLRHTPSDICVQLLGELLQDHPQSQDLTSYILALLTDDEAAGEGAGEDSPISAAPLRDLQLFGDCELAVLAAPPDPYARHAALVRAEYAQLSTRNYLELRIKVLNQFSLIPKVFHSPEFATLEQCARDNIEREILGLRADLAAGK